MSDRLPASVDRVWACARLHQPSAWSQTPTATRIVVLFYSAPEDDRLHAQWKVFQVIDGKTHAEVGHLRTRTAVSEHDLWDEIELFCEAMKDRAELTKIELVRIDKPLQEATLPLWMGRTGPQGLVQEDEPGGS